MKTDVRISRSQIDPTFVLFTLQVYLGGSDFAAYKAILSAGTWCPLEIGFRVAPNAARHIAKSLKTSGYTVTVAKELSSVLFETAPEVPDRSTLEARLAKSFFGVFRAPTNIERAEREAEFSGLAARLGMDY